MWTDSEIKGKILHKLVRFGKFKHSHTAIEHLKSGFPCDMAGYVKEMVKELIKEGILFVKYTNYGVHVSINSENKERIMYYIETFMKKE